MLLKAVQIAVMRKEFAVFAERHGGENVNGLEREQIP